MKRILTQMAILLSGLAIAILAKYSLLVFVKSDIISSAVMWIILIITAKIMYDYWFLGVQLLHAFFIFKNFIKLFPVQLFI